MSRAPGNGGDRTRSALVASWVPAQDGTGAAVDLVNSANNWTAGAGNDTMWSANAGYMSAKATGIGTDGSISAGTATPVNTWNSNTESLMIAMTIKSPVHGAAARAWGNSPGNSGGTAAAGIAIGTASNLARLGPRIYDGTNNIGTNDWAVDTLDDAPHSLVWFLDGIAKQYYTWIDGAIISNAASFSGITLGVANSTEALRIGRVGASTVNTRATSIRNLQIAKVTGRLPSNFAALAEAYRLNPFRPWAAADLA